MDLDGVGCPEGRHGDDDDDDDPQRRKRRPLYCFLYAQLNTVLAVPALWTGKWIVLWFWA